MQSFFPGFRFHFNFSIQLWNIWAPGRRHCHRSIHPQNTGRKQSFAKVVKFFNQPGTRGKYTFTINPGPGLAICKVADHHWFFIQLKRSSSDIIGPSLGLGCFCNTNLTPFHVPRSMLVVAFNNQVWFKLAVVGIGKNMACAQIPSGFVDKWAPS